MVGVLGSLQMAAGPHSSLMTWTQWFQHLRTPAIARRFGWKFGGTWYIILTTPSDPCMVYQPVDDQDDQLNVGKGTIYMDPMGTWMVELSSSWFSCRCNCTIQYYTSMHPMGTEGLALWVTKVKRQSLNNILWLKFKIRDSYTHGINVCFLTYIYNKWSTKCSQIYHNIWIRHGMYGGELPPQNVHYSKAAKQNG